MIRTETDCLVCFMKQAKRTLELCTTDYSLQYRLLADIAGMISTFPAELPPPQNAANYYRYISEQTNIQDPFAHIKTQSTHFALSLEQEIRAKIMCHPDPVLAAVHFAIGANVLDNGAQQQLDVSATLDQCLLRPLAINHFPELSEHLKQQPAVVYLADNCGEIVLDKLFIEQLLHIGCEVAVVVRGGPIINDATLADAAAIGLDALCPVFSSGAHVPGTYLPSCSAEVQQLCDSADLIISKGMGNFECLYGISAPVYFLFTVKCTNVRNALQKDFPGDPIDIGSFICLSQEKSNPAR